jgi:hypothetical protein
LQDGCEERGSIRTREYEELAMVINSDREPFIPTPLIRAPLVNTLQEQQRFSPHCGDAHKA